MSAARVGDEMRDFKRIWIGQLISALGTGFGSFSLGIWLFQQNRSATQYALMTFTGAITALLIGPLGGWAADRWDRRRLLMACAAGALCLTSIIAFLLYSGLMKPWYAYVLVALLVTTGVLQGPALMASITHLVPKGQFARASGMLQGSGALAAVISPPLAGTLLSVLGFHGLMLLDCASFVVVLATLWATPIPSPAVDPTARVSVLRGMQSAWELIRARPGLPNLLGLLAFTNLSFGIVQVLLAPLVLGFSTPAGLGLVNSLGAAGTLCGSLLLSAWGGPRSKVAGILGALVLQGSILLLGGLRPSLVLVGSAVFLFLFAMPISNGCNQAIWQRQIEPALQGRVFSIRQMVISCTIPLAALAAGPLADRVFSPLLLPGGPLAGSVGLWLGVGPGRGVGLLLMVVGLAVLTAAALASLSSRLRQVEREEEVENVDDPPPAPAAALEREAVVEEV